MGMALVRGGEEKRPCGKKSFVFSLTAFLGKIVMVEQGCSVFSLSLMSLLMLLSHIPG